MRNKRLVARFKRTGTLVDLFLSLVLVAKGISLLSSGAFPALKVSTSHLMFVEPKDRKAAASNPKKTCVLEMRSPGTAPSHVVPRDELPIAWL